MKLLTILLVFMFVTIGAPKPGGRLATVATAERGHDPANPADIGRLPAPGCVVLPCAPGAVCPAVCAPATIISYNEPCPVGMVCVREPDPPGDSRGW